ncbi:MAG: sugar transferase [Clostridiales Family XIII bacterium]|jgi:lipopolysaccharide/colanic/teichoic acid biosynthesis glycosyltransferase|nr:sugar transferase [Clostridiales Family XIII bacterium]
MIYGGCVKRLLDLLLSFVALLLLSPLFLALWVLVRRRIGKPAIFRQERPGKDARIFTLYKFRSMTDERDADGAPLPDADRLTPFGRMLRRNSLDELPELWNILKGDMSFIGPRPLLVRYLPLYSPEQARRHEVRPGLTGWAQVNGRNAISWEEKFRFDVEYVTRLSACFDLRICAKTLKIVLSREGISQEGEATMEEFKG